jgi:hypothetical protein
MTALVLTPPIEEQVAELLFAGWKKRTRHVWISPQGEWFLGPHQAWKVMREQGPGKHVAPAGTAKKPQGRIVGGL